MSNLLGFSPRMPDGEGTASVQVTVSPGSTPPPAWIQPSRAHALLLEGGRRGRGGGSSGGGLQMHDPLSDEPSSLGPHWSCWGHPRPPALDGVSGGWGLSVGGSHSHRGSVLFPGPESTGMEGVWRGPATNTQRRRPIHREGPGDSACHVVGTVSSVRLLCPGAEGPVPSLAQVNTARWV